MVILCILAAILSVLLFFYSFELFTQIEKLIQQTPWKIPSRIYSRTIQPEDRLPFPKQFYLDFMKRQEYQQADSPDWPGQYRESESSIELVPFLDMASNRILVVWDKTNTYRWIDPRTQQPLSDPIGEAELLASFYDDQMEDRAYLPFEEAPSYLIDSLLIQEDQSFYEHAGLDWRGVLRSAWMNYKENRIVQGGSTLTQQVTKNLFFSHEKSWNRKIKEILTSFYLEQVKSKEQILELYLNSCYMGQDGSINVYGMKEGAMLHFHRPPHRLSPAQCALLVSMIPAPNRYDPEKRPEISKERRDGILKRLYERSKLHEEEYQKALIEPIPDRKYKISGAFPIVSDFVKWELQGWMGEKDLVSKGYSISTTLLSDYQLAAEKAISEGLQELETTYPELKKHPQPLQAALVCLQGKTGEILAIVGGRDAQVGDYNRALQSKRQIGSLMKPFVYLCAFEQTLAGQGNWFPNTLILDEPVVIKTEQGEWKPENYTKKYLGEVTLRKALEKSLNLPAVKLGQQIGLDTLVTFLDRTQIMHCSANPSLPLGTIELTPLEVAQLYTLFLNDGMIRNALMVREILDSHQRVLYKKSSDPRTVASPISTYQVLSMLKGVLERGTAREIHQHGWQGIAAGKTGTAAKYIDSWFVGMTPDLVTVVWIGFDRPESLQLTGSEAAMPIWARFMKQLYPDGNSRDFDIPPGVIRIPIVYDTGKPAGDKKNNIVDEFFMSGISVNPSNRDHREIVESETEGENPEQDETLSIQPTQIPNQPPLSPSSATIPSASESKRKNDAPSLESNKIKSASREESIKKRENAAVSQEKEAVRVNHSQSVSPEKMKRFMKKIFDSSK